MNVPLLDLRAQNGALEEEMVAAFRDLLRSGQYIQGPALERFEAAAAAELGVRHALGVSSGTDAILLALMALGIGPGDEVIVPSFTFFATAGCVARLGATPVFADVTLDCFNLDVEDVASRITPRTKAVMPVHLFGQSADMDALLRLARDHGLKVIEDAAQAFGAGYRGRPVGSLGDFGTYSFFPSKNLGTLGDAGLLVTQDDQLADRARLLRVHGARPKYHHHHIGANFRMDTLHAALLEVKLPRLRSYAEARRANAAAYGEALAALPGVRRADLGACGCTRATAGPGTEQARMVLPVAHAHNEHIWNQYTVRVPGVGRRDALREQLTRRGIGTEIYYPIPLHRQVCFAPHYRGPLPVSECLADEVLSVPVYPELSSSQHAAVVSAIGEGLEALG